MAHKWDSHMSCKKYNRYKEFYNKSGTEWVRGIGGNEINIPNDFIFNTKQNYYIRGTPIFRSSNLFFLSKSRQAFGTRLVMSCSLIPEWFPVSCKSDWNSNSLHSDPRRFFYNELSSVKSKDKQDLTSRMELHLIL